jgi:hypothetical protein
MWRWPSWPGAIWPGTAPQTIETWPGGPGCRCATHGVPCHRSAANLTGRAARDGGLPPPRLLGAYDPLLLGWASREPVLGEHQPVITVNGLFRPFALVRGHAAALWTFPAGQVALSPLTRISAPDQAALLADAADVSRFLGPP